MKCNSINKYWRILFEGVNETTIAPKIKLKKLDEYDFECDEENQEPDMDWADHTRER